MLKYMKGLVNSMKNGSTYSGRYVPVTLSSDANITSIVSSSTNGSIKYKSKSTKSPYSKALYGTKQHFLLGLLGVGTTFVSAISHLFTVAQNEGNMTCLVIMLITLLGFGVFWFLLALEECGVSYKTVSSFYKACRFYTSLFWNSAIVSLVFYFIFMINLPSMALDCLITCLISAFFYIRLKVYIIFKRNAIEEVKRHISTVQTTNA